MAGSSCIRVLSGCLFLLLGLRLPLLAIDLEVEHLEVTQAIQDATNSVPLVGDRATAVRARIGMSGPAAAVPTVSGKLHITVDGSTVTPGAGLNAINSPFTPPRPADYDRSREEHTLNFEIPDTYRIPAGSNVTMKVAITCNPPDDNAANNSKEVDLRFDNPVPVRIFYTAVTFGSRQFPVLPDNGDAMVRGILPVDDQGSYLYDSMPGIQQPPQIPFTYDPDGNQEINDWQEANRLLEILSAWQQWLGGSQNTFVYGWANFHITDNGWANGNVAFGNIVPQMCQRTFAHEMAHCLGVGPHNNRKLDEVGWDTNNRLGLGRAKPEHLFDIMAAGHLTREAWIDTTTYKAILNSPAVSRAGVPGTPAPDNVVLSIQGELGQDGSRLMTKRPVFEYPPPVLPTRRAEKGRYIAEAVDKTGTVTSWRFDGRVFSAAAPEKELFGFFSVRIPAKKGAVTEVRLRDTESSRIVARWTRAPTAPELEVTSPISGDRIERNAVIEWKLKGTERKDIVLQVVYSPDGGKTFYPIGINVTENRLKLDTRLLPPKQRAEQGLIRIFASDGLNTVSAEISKLSLRE